METHHNYGSAQQQQQQPSASQTYIVPMGYTNGNNTEYQPVGSYQHAMAGPPPPPPGPMMNHHYHQAGPPPPPPQYHGQNEYLDYQQHQAAMQQQQEAVLQQQQQEHARVAHQQAMDAAAHAQSQATAAAVALQAQHAAAQQFQQQNQTAAKKDKRRQTILNKLNKLEEKFVEEKDLYYRSNLRDLQMSLSTLHSHTNEECLTKIQDYRELRDAELTRLRLSEEYLVYRTVNLFKQEYDKAQESYENLIKQVKAKLYDRINKKIVNLKHEKALMDVSTSIAINSSTFSSTQHHAIGGYSNGSGSRSRRREDSQRKRAAIETEYDSGYDSTGYTSQYAGNASATGGSSSRTKKKKTLGAGSNGYNSGGLTEDDFDQLTMDELDELLNDGGSETSRPGGHHGTRAHTNTVGVGSGSAGTGAGGSGAGGKRHKTVQDALRPLDDAEVAQDLKLMKNV